MKNQTPTFSVPYEVAERAMKNNLSEMMDKFKRRAKIRKFIYFALALLALCLLFSCTDNTEPNCDTELEQIETQRQDGWSRCNGSTTCISSINQSYESRKREILNNCE